MLSPGMISGLPLSSSLSLKSTRVGLVASPSWAIVTAFPARNVKPPATEMRSRSRCERSNEYAPGLLTSPVTYATWPAYSATKTLTCGSFTKWPSISLVRIIFSSSLGHRPRTVISPISGMVIVPSLLTRALCASSGVSKTVISSKSPGPSATCAPVTLVENESLVRGDCGTVEAVPACPACALPAWTSSLPDSLTCAGTPPGSEITAIRPRRTLEWRMLAFPPIFAEVLCVQRRAISVVSVVSVLFKVKVIDDGSGHVGVYTGEYLLGTKQILPPALLRAQHQHDEVGHRGEYDGVAKTDYRRGINNDLIKILAP